MKKYQLLMIASLYITPTAFSATYCVTSSAQLHDALTSAEINNQHDHIKIAEGYYLTTGSHFTYSESAGWDLEISGGWTEFFGNTCGQQLSGSPWNTVLDGNHISRIMHISSGGNSDIVIRNLTFLNGGYESLSSGGGGLYFRPPTGVLHTGQVTIERNAFINNYAMHSSALVFVSSSSKSYFRNNIFTLNESFDGSYSILIYQESDSGSYFTNNTVFNNKGDTINNQGGLHIFTTASSETLVANNILYDNGNRDLNIGAGASAGDVYLKTNNIGILLWVFPPIESIGNISVPPHFIPGLLSYTPASYSQLLNRGTHPYVCIVGNICIFPVPFDEAWGMGEVDTEGSIRVQHGRIDIGAVESPYVSELIFIDGFE